MEKLTVLIRAIGPITRRIWGAERITGSTLELHDSNGAPVATNDNWKVNNQDASNPGKRRKSYYDFAAERFGISDYRNALSRTVHGCGKGKKRRHA